MDLTPQQLLQQQAERAIDEMARQEAALFGTMGPAQRDGAAQTLRIFERVQARHNTSIAISVVLRLGILEVCRQPELLSAFVRMAQEGEVGVIRSG